MRDLVLALIIFGSIPLILMRPWVGVIMWNWISFMNPHRMSWGFMYEFQVAMVIGIATLIGWVLVQEDKRVPLNSITVLMFLLIAWTSLTTAFAVEDEQAIYQWKQFTKTILMTFVAISLMRRPERFRGLIWVSVLSIGYFSFKGGVFTMLTGGAHRVWGPPDTAIEDNNALAMATLMFIPLMFYLAKTAANRWVRLGGYIIAFSSIVSVIGSWSRGGLVGLVVIGIVLWWRSKQRAVIGIAIAVGVTIFVGIAPSQWLDRMDTIQNYEEDSSALGRLDIWGHAIRIANDRPIVGGGFGVFENVATYERLSPETNIRNVHSIYFEMLGTQGYPGLLLFLMLGSAGLLLARKMKRLTKDKPGFEDEYKFSNLIQISLIAYAVAGAFQNLSTFDGYYVLLAMIAIQYHLVTEKLKQSSTITEEASTDAKTASQHATTFPAGVPVRSFLRTPVK